MTYLINTVSKVGILPTEESDPRRSPTLKSGSQPVSGVSSVTPRASKSIVDLDYYIL